MELDESKLIELSKSGNAEAFEELALKYEKQVYTIAYRFMGNYEDACDLAQETFIKAFKSIRGFRGDASFKTWIFHIVTNVCRDELRKRKKRQVISLDAPLFTEEGELSRQAEDWTYSPERIYEGKEGQEIVQKMLDSLAPEYREVLIMRELQSFSYDEIAKKLNCTLGTVKSRLNRARKAMKDLVLAKQELFSESYRLISK
ncbi:sigma-70 family RNA polymerase sigma factor [Bacillota bacterium LX-D]|nr:sigma-70 family RNA polymerase sigma factor [Bacillota bacterium LX-D]